MAQRYNVSLPDELAKRYQKFADQISLSELLQNVLEEKLNELDMDKKILRIRTNQPLPVLVSSHSTGEWFINRERLAHCRQIQIYNWDRTEYIHGDIDHERVASSVLDSKRVVIGFKPKTAHPVSCEPIEWKAQNSIRYVDLEADTYVNTEKAVTEIFDAFKKQFGHGIKSNKWQEWQDSREGWDYYALRHMLYWLFRDLKGLEHEEAWSLGEDKSEAQLQKRILELAPELEENQDD